MGKLSPPSRSSLRGARRRQALLLLCFFAGGGAESITALAVEKKRRAPGATRRAFSLGQTGAVGAMRTLATRRLTAMSVTTFSELETAVGDGDALIDVAVGTMTFSTRIVVAGGNAVEITSAVAAELNGGSAVRLFRVNGDLTLRALSLTYGAVSTSSCDDPYAGCGGGAVYVGSTGSLTLMNCVVENNVAYVRMRRVRSPVERNVEHETPFLWHHHRAT